MILLNYTLIIIVVNYGLKGQLETFGGEGNLRAISGLFGLWGHGGRIL